MNQAKGKAQAANLDPSETLSRYGSSLPDSHAASPDHRALIDHVHILVLEVATPAGIRTRRTTHFSLRTAQAALDRATMRGRKASLILCQLVPVDGGGQHG